MAGCKNQLGRGYTMSEKITGDRVIELGENDDPKQVRITVEEGGHCEINFNTTHCHNSYSYPEWLTGDYFERFLRIVRG